MLDPSEVGKNSGIPIGHRPADHHGIMGNVEQPWLPVEAIDFLYSNLNKRMTGLEFGSGSSTFWFSKFTREIFSVESDEEWYNKNLENKNKFSIENVNLILSACPMLRIFEIDNEVGEAYEKYSDQIFKIGRNFDYILVDGVARSLCIKKSIDFLNPGGYLIIDNSERPAYWDSMSMVPKYWESFIFSNAVDRTTIFKKPH